MVLRTSRIVEASGTYLVTATRRPETDILSVYVDRVKKMAAKDETTEVLEGTLPLEAGDLVESTGELQLDLVH